LVVAQQRIDDERDKAISLAWHVAALSRTKKFPELRTLLKKRNRPQSVPEQKAMLHILSEQYGIPLKRGKARRG
jgi:hypothetical protein